MLLFQIKIKFKTLKDHYRHIYQWLGVKVAEKVKLANLLIFISDHDKTVICLKSQTFYYKEFVDYSFCSRL